MAKYFGLLLLLTTSFMVGCGQRVATEKEGTRGMDNVASFGNQIGAEKGAAKPKTPNASAHVQPSQPPSPSSTSK
jgi:hypothetical protein